MLGFAEEIKNLAGNASTQTDSLETAQQYIQDYIDGIGTAGIDETRILTQKFIDGCLYVTFKLSCLTKKLDSFNYATDECAIGSANITELYDKIQKPSVGDAKGCVDNGYIQFKNFSDYVNLTMIELGKSIFFDGITWLAEKFPTYYLIETRKLPTFSEFVPALILSE